MRRSPGFWVICRSLILVCMLSWKQNAFKVLIIGGAEEVISIVEKRIGKDFKFELEVQQLDFSEVPEVKDRLSEVDLIFVEVSHQSQLIDLIHSSVQFPSGFIPSIGFRMQDTGQGQSIEFFP